MCHTYYIIITRPSSSSSSSCESVACVGYDIANNKTGHATINTNFMSQSKQKQIYYLFVIRTHTYIHTQHFGTIW